MAIIAICPFCRQGKVRAPLGAIGLSANCPSCYSCFTIVKSDEPVREPVQAASSLPPALLPSSVPTEPALDAFSPTLPDAPVEPVKAARRKKAKPKEPEPTPLPFDDGGVSPSPLGKGLALLAIILGGVGLGASQVPYGWVGTIALAALGILMSLIGWAIDSRRPWLPASASAWNLAILLVLMFFPNLLSLGSWWPVEIPDDSKTILAVNLNGVEQRSADGWIDVTKEAWQRDGVRVSLRDAVLAPVELKGPKNEKRLSDQRFLQLSVRVANEGAARAVEFLGWNHHALPRLVDSRGQTIPLKTFGDLWAPVGQTEATTVFPGKSAIELLVFELPANGIAFLRLELPGSAFGDSESVRLQIPQAFLDVR